MILHDGAELPNKLKGMRMLEWYGRMLPSILINRKLWRLWNSNKVFDALSTPLDAIQLLERIAECSGFCR